MRRECFQAAPGRGGLRGRSCFSGRPVSRAGRGAAAAAGKAAGAAAGATAGAAAGVAASAAAPDGGSGLSSLRTAASRQPHSVAAGRRAPA